MKKTYIAPQTETVEIKVQQMLATSVLSIGNEFAGTETVLAPETDLDEYFNSGTDLDKFFE